VPQPIGNAYGMPAAIPAPPTNVYGAVPPRSTAPYTMPSLGYQTPAPYYGARRHSVMGQVALITGLMPILAIIMIAMDDAQSMIALMVLVWVVSSIIAIATGVQAIRAANRGEVVNRGMGLGGLILGIFFVVVLLLIVVYAVGSV